MKKDKQDEDREHWELRDEEDLAFPCRPFFYNKLGQEIESYILDHNERGYTWGYFWLVGRRVGQATTKSRRMVGKRCEKKAAVPPVGLVEVTVDPRKKVQDCSTSVQWSTQVACSNKHK
jgi:hypothetical protein